jgi:hypothetical protein
MEDSQNQISRIGAAQNTVCIINSFSQLTIVLADFLFVIYLLTSVFKATTNLIQSRCMILYKTK